MKDLQKSLKNPFGNLNLVVAEGVKRTQRYIAYKMALFDHVRIDVGFRKLTDPDEAILPRRANKTESVGNEVG